MTPALRQAPKPDWVGEMPRTTKSRNITSRTSAMHCAFMGCCTVQVEACSHDSTDSLIRAQHTALLDYGGSMSSSNSMTCPTTNLLASPRGASSLGRGKSKSPLQLETRSWSASQMRSMSADRRASAIGSPSFLRKVAVMFRSLLSNTSMDEESSTSSK